MVLDADWILEKEIDNNKALCLDGTFLGNVARYVNHCCWDATSSMLPSQLKMIHNTIIMYVPTSHLSCTKTCVVIGNVKCEFWIDYVACSVLHHTRCTNHGRVDIGSSFLTVPSMSSCSCCC